MAPVFKASVAWAPGPVRARPALQLGPAGAGGDRRGSVLCSGGRGRGRFLPARADGSTVLPGCPPPLPSLPASQVLQGGGLESPTKPKGRPKKNSIPSSEQLSEQERARDAEKPPESLGSPAEVSQEE